MISQRWPITTVDGLIERRLLINFRVDADRLSALLPRPLEPRTVGGWGMAGICLIRLRKLSVGGLPALGLASENSAHRLAVQWQSDSGTENGVYIARRDTDSTLTALMGGRIFPGAQRRAEFIVDDSPASIRDHVTTADGAGDVDLRACPAQRLPHQSVFGSLADASAFFESGAVGFSPSSKNQRLEGLCLTTKAWTVAPLDVSELRSSFFAADGPDGGAATFDSALVMRNVSSRWVACEAPELTATAR